MSRDGQAKSHLELFGLLGGDDLAGRILSVLWRRGVQSPDALRRVMDERPGFVEGFRGIGPVAIKRIRERLGIADSWMEAYAELWDFLGRDALGTRITDILIRKGGVKTVEELRELVSKGRMYVLDLPGIGSKSVGRIWERVDGPEW